MALKDWKKVVDNKNSKTVAKIIMSWRNKTTGNIVSVEKSNQFVPDKDTVFYVESDGEFKKVFKNKTRAIAYAKRYMRGN